jgi:hypothetical protein
MVIVSSGIEARAQTAQEIVDRAAKVYADAQTYSAVATRRDASVFMIDSNASAPRYEVRSLNYTQTKIKFQRPDDWLVLQRQAIWIDSSRTANGSGGLQSGQSLLLVKRGNNPPQCVQYFGNTARPLGGSNAQMFDVHLDRALRGYGAGDFVLQSFRGASQQTSNIPFGLISPQFKEDKVSGETAYCIKALNTAGDAITLWINKQTFCVFRAVVQSSRSTNYGPPRGFGPSSPTGQTSGTMVRLTEFVYDQVMNPEFRMGAFNEGVSGQGEINLDKAGFGTMDELVGLAVVEKNVQAPPAAESAPTLTPPPVEPAVAQVQALTAEQMGGIVLIEGDEGTATGFMTQIRGVDFVVTNEHVLGSNKKISIKNLRGEIIPVTAVYGAVGSDVAILRIGHAEGGLKIAEDVLQSVKIGDKIVVVGNRLGGGVATQTSGQVLGVGPIRIEVNANFEPGNSGSPIFSTASNEVVGVATYSETRKVSIDDTSGSSRYNGGGQSQSAKVEKRWFGYRLDGITKWESIDMARWHAQGERIDKFRELSDALVAVIKFDFNKASENDRLAPIIADFEAHAEQMKRDKVGVAGAVKDLMRTIRSVAEASIADFSSADYYDYYRTCLYWEQSVPMQLEYRKDIVDVLKKYEANSSAYVSRMRNGGN